MEEVNIPQAGGDPGWPDPPVPERPHADARGRTAGLRSGSRSRWAIGLCCAVLLAGVLALGVTLAGGGGPRGASAVLTGNGSRTAGAAAAAGSSGFAAGGRPGGAAHPGLVALEACIASARHLRATGHRAAARAKVRACVRRFLRQHPHLAYRALAASGRGRLARLAALARHAMHGQVTVATKKGPRTIAFERGTVQSVSGNSVVVKAADGVTWTWQFGARARVFRAGRLVGADALADGRRVAVVGLLSGGSGQARRIMIRASS